MTNLGYTLDPSVWRSPDGRTIIGGSDFTIVGLDPDQVGALDQLLLHGVDDDLSDFATWCLARNLVQPGAVRAGSTPVALVIPCRDHQEHLDRLLAGLDLSLFAEIVVVDDGSLLPIRSDVGAVHRNPLPLGPAATRNVGWRKTTAPVVVFLDADVRTDGSWLESAGALLSDPTIAAVAPRVTSSPTAGRASRWEQVRPALDLGTERSAVRPRTRVPYVPTAALAVRRDALESVDGFDDHVLLGEDVDLVWRLHDAGWTVRYEPGLEVTHLPRPTIGGWVRQRFRYGRSNAVLANAHPGHVAALELTVGNAALLLGFAPWRTARFLAALGAVINHAVLTARLEARCDQPSRMALILQGDGVGYALDATAQSLRRSYWPLAAAASIRSRHPRWLFGAALAVPAIHWLTAERPAPLHRWLAASIADDIAFGAGVWWESLTTGSFRALRVHLSRLDRFLPDDVPTISRR